MAMLTKLATKFDYVSTTLSEYALAIDYELVHRDDEHEEEQEI